MIAVTESGQRSPEQITQHYIMNPYCATLEDGIRIANMEQVETWLLGEYGCDMTCGHMGSQEGLTVL